MKSLKRIACVAFSGISHFFNMRSLVFVLAYSLTCTVAFKAAGKAGKDIDADDESAAQSKAAAEVKSSGSMIAAEAGDVAQTMRNAHVVDDVKNAASKVKSEVEQQSPAVKSDLRFLGFAICVAALLGVFVYLVNI